MNDFICPVCGKPTKRKISLFGTEQIVDVLCDCECEKTEREKIFEEIKYRNKLKQIHEKAAPIELRKEIAQKTFENDKFPDSQLSKFARNYADKWKEMYENNISVVFWGNCGNGKTYYAMCIANELMNNLVYVCITSIAEIINMDINERGAFINSLNKYPLLILDDMGTERQNDYAREILYTIVNGRYLAKKPIIFTTNYTKDDIVQKKIPGNERTFDRIEEMAVFVQAKGESVRSTLAQEKREQAIKLLYGKD